MINASSQPFILLDRVLGYGSSARAMNSAAALAVIAIAGISYATVNMDRIVTRLKKQKQGCPTVSVYEDRRGFDSSFCIGYRWISSQELD
jgi:hypothetical protein